MMELSDTLNINYIESQYALWKSNPKAVQRDWQIFFEGFEIAGGMIPSGEGVCTEDQALRQARVEALKYRYRDIGHLLACLDPLSACPTDHPLLNIKAFNLTEEDLDRKFYTRRFSDTQQATLREIIKSLKETYCRSIGVEYMHLQDPDERKWLQDRMEPNHNQPMLHPNDRIRILKKLSQAAIFEAFLNKKYAGQTRFSLEGAETLIPMLDTLFLQATHHNCSEIILGMAHRGRLNVLTNVLFKPYEEVFREFINSYDPDSLVGAGDVKYHNGYFTDIQLANNRQVRVFLMNNPSHLEAVDPVVEGIVRARQELLPKERRNQVLPVLIHGDAAFAGQGVVAETLNLSQLEGYRTEGTVHIVINNQIGYTTLPEHARSTRYSTDIAKMIMVPIFHVHGENPEAAVHVVKLALDYRQAFAKDVVIDLVCYRRHGHNEGDEPYFTQPLMYERIRERPSIHILYGNILKAERLISESDIETIEKDIYACLTEAFDSAARNPKIFPKQPFYEIWSNYTGNYGHEPVKTSVSEEMLLNIARKLNEVPKGFSLHPKLEKLFSKRLQAVETGKGIDWANAEALAFGSLLSEGIPIRLSGQDCGRGTFSQRHAVVYDMTTGNSFVPLNELTETQARIDVINSSLSEVSVLGFEYGFALVRPESLVIWEAQFGDFANNAQTVIDLFIAPGETKWQRRCGLVMLLPHGLEGQGPEHSSARLERFLQLCADDNMIVCYPSTPAQYFHLLRRQVKSKYRKPLIVMGPKSLLRNPQATSQISELSNGQFQEIIETPSISNHPKRVLYCSGKLYYELISRRDSLSVPDVHIVRIEQLYPLPISELERLSPHLYQVQDVAWIQEEPENMGAWRFIRPYLEKILNRRIRYIGRKASPSPATGFANIYKQEQAAILDKAFEP